VSFQDDVSHFHHVSTTGEFQGRPGVLLHQDYGDAAAADLAQGLEDRLDEQGCESQAWFVEKEEPGVGHEGAADGEHLLFTAGKRPAELEAGDLFRIGKSLNTASLVSASGCRPLKCSRRG